MVLPLPSPDLVRANLRGAAFMVFAMALFAVEDSLLKGVAAHLPVGEVLILFGLGGSIVFAGLTVMRGERIFHPALRQRVMALRAVSEITGRVFFTLSLALTTLSATSAILQATPLVVAAAGSFIFGERVGLRRWFLIGLGFVGVLMVLRPGAGDFSALSILAILGMLGFAGRDLATRAAPATLSYAQLGLYGFVPLIVAGTALMVWQGGAVMPVARDLALLLAAVIIGVIAYTSLTMAMRMGELSAVTPFRYSRLLFGMGMGVVVFGETPSFWDYAGGAVIVVAGLMIMLSSRRRR
ncbi:DMT family transporter [Celeribacter arenosi]|uniref:DMT family transporter n=1 Tax=Celeribacter arenosi TaxID=792649 RepID=A0ABP7KE16_9RHOB